MLTVSQIRERFKLHHFNPDVNNEGFEISEPDVNRLSLQLTGFFDFFAESRVQLVGKVENAYLQTLTDEEKAPIYEKLFTYKIPCVIFTRDIEPEPYFMECANKAGVPIFGSPYTTGEFVVELIQFLNVELAPKISIHGVLVDVYGVGVLIIGESGIGKSETALELIRRGHRLVADDVVDICRINEHTLTGTSPTITKYLLEVRGIGIIDVQKLFGTECILEEQNIDLVLKLTEWVKGDKQDFDRLGLEEEYTEYLGNKVVCQTVPIRPGRNTAVICEVAAVNYRQKSMGYNAAQELYRRVQANIQNNEKGD